MSLYLQGVVHGVPDLCYGVQVRVDKTGNMRILLI